MKYFRCNCIITRWIGTSKYFPISRSSLSLSLFIFASGDHPLPRFLAAATTSRGYYHDSWTVPVAGPRRRRRGAHRGGRGRSAVGRRKGCFFDSHKPLRSLILIGSVEIAASCFGNPPPPPPVLIKSPIVSTISSSSNSFAPEEGAQENPPGRLLGDDGRPF